MMKKLLLADDSITIQKVVGIIFSTEEYQLEMTDNGDSALDKALAEIPDLVIADISMPGKDGFELCQAIKSEPSLANTSVLLLPGAFDHFDEVKAGEVCADGWLAKPFESQALLDKVSQLLEAEPVRMAGIATSTEEEKEIATAVAVAAIVEDHSIGEEVLGLDTLDEIELATEESIEESPDDIWNAVSFAEEDLQKSSTSSVDEVSFAADVIDPSAGGTDEIDLVTAEAESNPAEKASEFISEEEFQPASFLGVAAEEDESVTELNDQVDEVEESESVDFSIYRETDEKLQGPATEVIEESTYFVPADENAESLELGDELAEESTEVSAESVDTFTETDDDPFGLIETDLAEQEEVVIAKEELVSFVVESDDDEEIIMELQEEDEQDDFEPEIPEPVTSEESTVFVTEAVDLDTSEDDEIFNLSIDEIVADELIAETAEEEAVEEIKPFAVEAAKFKLEPELETESKFKLEVEPEPVAEVAELVDEEEESFYFDATSKDEEAAEGDDVEAVTTDLIDDDYAVEPVTVGSATEQIEQQLRELSEAELKDVVAKVAGPIIERLAGEMLEKIAWEVVPDLAEAMISEEIRKIKEGE